MARPLPHRRSRNPARLLARRMVIAMLAWSSVGGAGAQAVTRASTDELGRVLGGIVHYTRWPEPAAALRLCVDAREDFADPSAARRLAEAIAGAITVTIEVRRFDVGGAALQDCNALFIGDASPAAWQRLLKDLVNRPVLTIGVGEEFCSWGGMFCLERASAALRVRANLDAISRSGLRVNPQLLRLTQRDTKVAR